MNKSNFEDKLENIVKNFKQINKSAFNIPDPKNIDHDYDEEDLVHMDRMYNSMSKGELMSHFISCRSALEKKNSKKSKKNEFKIDIESNEKGTSLRLSNDGYKWVEPFPSGTTEDTITEGQMLDLVERAKKSLILVKDKTSDLESKLYKLANPRK